MLPGFNWAVVEVMLNGEGPFRMIVDTGAGTTVLNADLVAELGLESRGTRRIGDPSRPRAHEVDELTLDMIQVGDATFRGVEAIGWRGPPLVGIGGIRGVLGFPTFKNCLVTFDYPAQLLEISAGALPPADGRRVLDMGTAGMPTITIDVAGIPIVAHLDTGNSGSLSIPQSYESELPLVAGSKSRGTGARGGSPIAFTIAQLDGNVSLGEAVFERPRVHLSDTLNSANVGFELLRHLRITLDQRNGRVRFEQPSVQGDVRRANAAPGTRRMGVQMAMKNGTLFEAVMVVPGSEAEKVGLRAGDAFLEVDGSPFSQQNFLKALQGTGRFTLTIERAG